MVSSHCVGQTKPSADFGKSTVSLAASQCVMPTSGTSIFISAISRAAVAAPFSWPEIISRSGLSAFTLVKKPVMSLRSFGMRSSTTAFILYFLSASTTPERTSSENGSSWKIIATLTVEGSLPAFLARVGCDVDDRRQIFLRRRDDAEVILVALLNSERAAASACTIGVLYFSVTGRMALASGEL